MEQKEVMANTEEKEVVPLRRKTDYKYEQMWKDLLPFCPEAAALYEIKSKRPRHNLEQDKPYHAKDAFAEVYRHNFFQIYEKYGPMIQMLLDAQRQIQAKVAELRRQAKQEENDWVKAVVSAVKNNLCLLNESLSYVTAVTSTKSCQRVDIMYQVAEHHYDSHTWTQVNHYRWSSKIRDFTPSLPAPRHFPTTFTTLLVEYESFITFCLPVTRLHGEKKATLLPPSPPKRGRKRKATDEPTHTASSSPVELSPLAQMLGARFFEKHILHRIRQFLFNEDLFA